jgi:hypothetical protein
VDWALADFSGYIAADEVYDGPFCVLSTLAPRAGRVRVVDNHTFKRVFYQILERNQAPTQAIVAAFFGRFREALHARGRQVAGTPCPTRRVRVTSDGSDLYPPAILSACGAIPHQICEFHVLKQITLAVLHAVAKVRKDLTPKAQAETRAAVHPRQGRPAQRAPAAEDTHLLRSWCRYRRPVHPSPSVCLHMWRRHRCEAPPD